MDRHRAASRAGCGAVTAVLLGAAALGAARADAPDPAWIARSTRGMVASDAPQASRVGAQVLADGGNAFDAAVATSLALEVARPESCGLGGGGFLVAYVAAESRFVALDFRETAPAGATAQRYAALRDGADAPAWSASLYGGDAVATPGLLAGLVEINERWGSRPLRDLALRAAELAERGLIVDAHTVGATRAALRAAERWPALRERLPGVFDVFAPGGAPLEEGATLKRPEVAQALRLIAERGREAIHGGPIGEAMVAAVRAAGGTLTLDDLRSYRVIEREPLRGRWGDAYEIISMPPPSSGGTCLIEALNIMHVARMRSDLHPQDDRAHVLIEALKHAFADRARHLGDPDFTALPVAEMLDLRRAAEAARAIRPRETLAHEAYGLVGPRPAGAERQPDDAGTSHFCVADAQGNIVAITQTINGSFGSLVVAAPYSIVLNNEMDDFLTVPGEANLFGLTHGRANLVAPGKRPLSSMSPTIVLKDGRPLLALGASGGPRIITSVLGVALDVMDGATLEQAMRNVRIHHQWSPDHVVFDRPPSAALVEALRERGHAISERRGGGDVQAIRFLEDGTMVGASDPGKGGRPAGVD